MLSISLGSSFVAVGKVARDRFTEPGSQRSKDGTTGCTEETFALAMIVSTLIQVKGRGGDICRSEVLSNCSAIAESSLELVVSRFSTHCMSSDFRHSHESHVSLHVPIGVSLCC